MDFTNPDNIKNRTVKEVTHAGEPARVVSVSATLDADLEGTWDALTNRERIPRWFLPVSGDLQCGGNYQLKGNAGGKITRCDPLEAFDVTWEWDGNISWVQVRLDAHEGGTGLTLEHITPRDEASEEHWRKYGPAATGVGWDLGFIGLLLHLRTGESVPQEEFNAWLVTEDGRTFIHKCAAAWGDAHIRSGEDEAIAQALAKQTAQFYCGG